MEESKQKQKQEQSGRKTAETFQLKGYAEIEQESKKGNDRKERVFNVSQ